MKTQQDAIKALIDKDNANSGTTHIRTVIKQGPVIENTDELKKAYQDLLQTAKDNAVRDWNTQKAYYKGQGKTNDEAETLANKAIASHFLTWNSPIKATTVGPASYEGMLRSLGAKVTEVPVTQAFPTLPLGADASSNDPKVVEYKQAWKAFNDKVLDVYKSNDVIVKFINSLREGAVRVRLLGSCYQIIMKPTWSAIKRLNRKLNPWVTTTVVLQLKKLLVPIMIPSNRMHHFS